MRQYVPGEVQISWFGLDLTEGLSQGSFLKFRRNKSTWTWLPNGLGGGVRMHTKDRSGEVDLEIETASRTHQELLTLASADNITGHITGPMIISDLNTRERFSLRGAFILTEPDEQRSNQSLPITWTWAFISINHSPNLRDLNVVGS